MTCLLLVLPLVRAQDGTESSSSRALLLGSGAANGFYYPIARALSESLDNQLRVNVLPPGSSVGEYRGGSLRNVRALAKTFAASHAPGEASNPIDLAIVQNDVAYYAFTGQAMRAFDGNPVDNIRALAALYAEPLHVLVRNDSDIKSFNDLKGKRILVGESSSELALMVDDVLTAHHFDEVDLAQAAARNPVPSERQALIDGDLDAIFYTTGLSSNVVASLMAGDDIRLLSLNENAIDSLVLQRPFYRPYTISDNSYGEHDGVTTIAVSALLVAREALNKDEAYEITKTLLEHYQSFEGVHQQFLDDFSISGGIAGSSIPLHDGAERYYRERGWLR